jgi:hypothetical protein
MSREVRPYRDSKSNGDQTARSISETKTCVFVARGLGEAKRATQPTILKNLFHRFDDPVLMLIIFPLIIALHMYAHLSGLYDIRYLSHSRAASRTKDRMLHVFKAHSHPETAPWTLQINFGFFTHDRRFHITKYETVLPL